MKKILALVFISLIFLLATFFVIKLVKDKTINKEITGCYVAQIEKNVYSLKLNNQQGNKISGTIKYDNFQFDDSSGTFDGKIEGSFIIGNYSFNSEGMQSNRELIFKVYKNGLIQGFGDYKQENGIEIFEDKSKIIWNPTYTYFKKTCEI